MAGLAAAATALAIVGAPGQAFAGPPVRQEVDARVYQWRGGDQISAIIDATAGPRFYDHDGRGRLIRERRSDAVVERAMDEVGNVFRTADRRDRRYGPGGRLEFADGIEYEHDEDGNQTRKVGPDGEWRYSWNGHGMLREVERPDGLRVQFEYDPFARRTVKGTLTADGIVERETAFVWDGHVVIHELDSDRGLTTWHWEPGTFTPVSKERGDRRWSVATDHLGTPTEMYDELGELAWKMQLDVFGVPQFEHGRAEDCPWRWPGQYDDGDAGQFYNRFRYYMPHLGRYASRDPLGLRGGAVIHGYPTDSAVRTDPHGLIDPWEIQFSQDSISDVFTDSRSPWAGRPLEEAIAEAHLLGRLPEGLTLNLQEWGDGRLVTLNNRTLYIAQQANLVHVSPNFVGPEGDNLMRRLLDGHGPLPIGEQPTVRCGR